MFITRVLLNALCCVHRVEYYTALQKSEGILYAQIQKNLQGKISKIQSWQDVLCFCAEGQRMCLSVYVLQLGTEVEERLSLYTF